MRIAIPLADGKLCPHFGHCQQFALLDTDEKTGAVTRKQLLVPPPHEPGVLPRWLHEQGANVIIAGGMGNRAQQLFVQNGIKVVVGAPAEQPEKLVADYVAGTLRTGSNLCDH
ncbi:MAG: NifB/NifX family molybdenum-iron cluster-binding protein [candidate division WOR-3 bacterium]